MFGLWLRGKTFYLCCMIYIDNKADFDLTNEEKFGSGYIMFFFFLWIHKTLNRKTAEIKTLLLCTARSTDLSRLRKLRDALVEEAEFLDMGVGTSPFWEELGPSLSEMGRGPAGMDSWTTMTSSLFCWPRCSLAKSKPFTLGACN